MKIWGRANSINVMKVLWTADECGLKYERINVGLAFGGKLDISQNWTSPHATHDRGTAGDIAGLYTTSECATENSVVIDEFLTFCSAEGAVSSDTYNEGGYAHCNFADPSTYPH